MLCGLKSNLMKSTFKYYYFISIILLTAACSSDDSVEIDEEKPTITVNYTAGFPQGCALLTRGETYNFRAMVTDNNELAAYSIDDIDAGDYHCAYSVTDATGWQSRTSIDIKIVE